MSIRLRAMLYTAGFVASVIVGSFALSMLLQVIPEQYYFPMFVAGLILYGVWSTYSFTKSHLEFKEKMAELNAKK